ncbi:MAG: cell division protein FtsZ, partial [Prevotellaceae bacterium]|nr:cell division protein FtsZ [Prevotellaceae bacterium]
MSDNASQPNEKKHFEPIVELTPSEKPEAPVAVIKVIGVGGGGGNAVSNMYRENVEGVRFLVCNTDAKALAASLVPEHVQLGPGLGAGGRPERGRELAEENVEAIREALEDDLNMVFITAGMGGGTGTGAAPVIAREAMAKGILTVGIVTIPFLFEQKLQVNKALDGVERISKEVDALLIVNNQRLFDIYRDLSVRDAFKKADDTLTDA